MVNIVDICLIEIEALGMLDLVVAGERVDYEEVGCRFKIDVLLEAAVGRSIHHGLAHLYEVGFPFFEIILGCCATQQIVGCKLVEVRILDHDGEHRAAALRCLRAAVEIEIETVVFIIVGVKLEEHAFSLLDVDATAADTDLLGEHILTLIVTV